MKRILLCSILFLFSQIYVSADQVGNYVSEVTLTSNNIPFDKDNGFPNEPSDCTNPFNVYITSDNVIYINALYHVGNVTVNIYQNGLLIYHDQIDFSNCLYVQIHLPQGTNGSITIEISNANGANLYGTTIL